MKKLSLLALSVLSLSACVSNPSSIGKVTDPADPRFDPMKFSYLDYKGVIDRRSVINKLFPIGTNKSKVDQILVETGKAVARKVDPSKHKKYKNSEYIYVYRYSGSTAYRDLMGWGNVSSTLIFYFDKNENVVAIFDNYNHFENYKNTSHIKNKGNL